MITSAFLVSVQIAASVLGTTTTEQCLAVLEGATVVEVDRQATPGDSIDPFRVDHYWCWSAVDPPQRLESLELNVDAAEAREIEAIEVRIVPVAEGPCTGAQVIAGPIELWREADESQLPHVAVGASCVTELLRGKGEAWRLRATRQHAGSWWVDLPARQGKVDLPLAPAEPLRFQTVDNKSELMASVRLELLSRDHRGRLNNLVRIGIEDGALEIPALPSSHRVTAVFIAPGFIPQTFEGFPAALPRRIAFEPSATLRGRFVDADEAPIPGVELEAEAWIGIAATVLARRQATSAVDGSWDFEDLPLGDVVLVATAPRFATLRRQLELTTLATDLGAIVLRPSAVLDVLVVDPEGVSVAGATLKAHDTLTVISDQDGRAALLGLPIDQPIDLAVDAKGFIARRLKVVQRGAEPISVTLEPAFEIVGQFVTAQGDTVAEGRVEILAGRSTRYERLDADGGFRLELPPSVPVEARFLSAETRRLTLHLDPGHAGEVRDLGELRAPPGRIVTGRVLDEADASPVAGAHIWLPRPSADTALSAWIHGDVLETVTDIDGWFRLGGLDAGSTEIRVEAPAFAQARFRVVADAQETTDMGDLSLTRGITVEVEVESEVSATAMARLDLVGKWLESDMLSAPVHEGIARFEQVPSGRATLSVVDGRQLVCEEEIEVPGGTETGTKTASFPCRRQTLAVTGVVEVAGRRAGPGRLSWLPESTSSPAVIMRRSSPLGLEHSRAFGGGRPQVDVDVAADGYFATDKLRAGHWDVVWLPEPGGSSQPIAVTLPQQQLVEVPLAFPGHVIEGRVVDLDGAAVAGARVRELGAGGFAQSAEDGTFRFLGISDGTYYLRADAGGKESATVQLELTPEEQVVAVELVLGTRERNEALEIFTVDEEEHPLAGAFVFLDTGPNGLRILTTDAAGRALGHFDPPFPDRVRLAGWANGRWYFGSYIPYAAALQEPQLLIWSTGGTLVLRSPRQSTSVQITTETGWDLSALMARLGRAPVSEPDTPLVVEALPPGRYRLVADGREWFRQVDAGRSLEIEIGPELP